MPRVECTCGVTYRVPDSAVGKQARCKKCGAVLSIEADTSATIPLVDDVPENAQAPSIAAAALPTADSPGRIERPVVETVETKRTYVGDLISTILFPRSVSAVITFVFVCGMIYVARVLLPAAFVVGMIGQIIVFGWYSAWRFNVISEAASGEEELPGLTMEGGAFESIIIPMLKWVGSWAVVLMPAFVYSVVAISAGWMPSAAMGGLLGGIPGLFSPQAAATWAFVGLVLLGMFCWPIMVLCAALAGFACLHRIDLMVSTVARTFPAYATTLIIIGGAQLLDYLVRKSFGGFSIVAPMVSVYLEVIALRAIGLYYHHFKDRFAWSWG